MAATVNLEFAFSRQDTLRVSPKDVRTGRDSRVIPAANQDDLDKQRAVSIINDTQLQPVPVRRDADLKLVTVAGNTRHRAVQLIHDGFEYDGVAYPPNPEATLWVAIQKMTDDEAFDAGVIENSQRNDATVLQEALAQDVYRQERKLNDTEIAKRFGYSNTNRVAALKKLLACDEGIKQAAHAGKLSLDAALKLQSQPEDKRAEALAKIEAGEKVTAASVKKQANEDAEGDDEGDEATEKKFEKRSIKNFKDFVADAKDNADQTHAELLEKLGDWFAGKVGDRALWNTLNKYTKG